MMYIKKEHLDFVPEKDKGILVFSHNINKRKYKKKVAFIGQVFLHPKTNEYAFLPNNEISLGYRTLSIVTDFIIALNEKILIYDEENLQIKKP